jgi:hypothetical protein
VIGVLGGYGAVGVHASRLLHRWGVGPLRVGGRHVETAKRFVASELSESTGRFAPAHARAVDVDDDVSLTRFVEGCTAVVNCAGPSHRMAERVAVASLRSGAHYIDAGGDELIVEHVATGARCAVFFAGTLPGLSGLLPRWLASRDFDEVHDLTVYAGVFDRFTQAGAEDYLHGVGSRANEPLAAWRDGRRRSAALPRRRGVRLPYFSGEVSTFPYLDAECELVAWDLSLRHGRWHSVVDGAHLSTALDRIGGRERPAQVTELCRASALDVAGRTPYVTLLVQLDGMAAGHARTRTAVLRAGSIAALTGNMTALAALAVLRGEVRPGAHRAATALDPTRAVERLRELLGLGELRVMDTTIDELAVAEEGVV